MMDAAGRVFGSNRLGLVAEESGLKEQSAALGGQRSGLFRFIELTGGFELCA
jgi:hypothetical protein